MNELITQINDAVWGYVLIFALVGCGLWFTWRTRFVQFRMVGRTLRYTPGAEALPCHRVVNKEGRTAPGWGRQRTLLEEEGVHFRANGHVDMSRYLWEPSS